MCAGMEAWLYQVDTDQLGQIPLVKETGVLVSLSGEFDKYTDRWKGDT